MPSLPRAARCSGVCKSSFMVPMRMMVAILLESATYWPTATGRAVMKPSKGARMVVSARAFSDCASWDLTPASEACEFSTAPQLWRAPLSVASYCWRAGQCLGGFQGGAGGDGFRHEGRIERALAAETDARLGLPHAGGRLIQGGAGLIEVELRVAVVEFADDLALFDEIADVNGRRKHAPGHQRRDVTGFIGDEGAGLLEGGRDGTGDGLRRGNRYLLGP